MGKRRRKGREGKVLLSDIKMNGTTTFALPTGLWLEDSLQRDVTIRPLNEMDEVSIVEAYPSSPLVQLTTAQITKCVLRLGSLKSIPLQTARSLQIGDREAIMLQIRKITFGDDVHCNLDCVSENCDERIGLHFKVSDILTQPYLSPKREYETDFENGECKYNVKFRLPTGADQEDAYLISGADPESAVARLANRCIKKITKGNEEIHLPLPHEALGQLSTKMAELDPQAETVLAVRCPACHFNFSITFDAANLLFQEAIVDARVQLRQVHEIATRYHWSEREILSLSRRKRRLYIGLIENDTILS